MAGKDKRTNNTNSYVKLIDPSVTLRNSYKILYNYNRTTTYPTTTIAIGVVPQRNIITSSLHE